MSSKIWTAFCAIVFVSAAIVALAQTAPAPIWKTGQTISYYAGDDGDLRKGVPWPSPRFTDNGDGTVTDNLTGLIWLKDANCIQTSYASFDQDGTVGNGSVTWQHALDFVKGINNGTYAACRAGHTDWRLPNAKELRSLVDYSKYNPALPTGQPFVNVGSNMYWSSTTFAYLPYQAWRVALGQDATQWSISKDTPFAVWPVRTGPTGCAPAPVAGTGQTTCYDSTGTVISCAGTGQDGELRAGVAWPGPQFTVGTGGQAGCVTDNLTGLIWSRSPETATMTWTAALTYASNFSLCGQTDWRLPDVNEIESLLNAQEALIAPWLEGQGFTNVQAGDYWSSTTPVCLLGCTGWAWVVGIDRGGVGTAPKGESLHVWFVRGGDYLSLGTADLSVTNSDSPDPVPVGNDVTYTITITNNGPDPATAVSLTDTLQAPPAVSFVSATSTKGTCQTQIPTITCLIGNMSAGEVVTATIVLRPTDVGTTCNTAGVAGTTNDPERSNDAVTQCTTLQQDTTTQTVLTVYINPAGGGTVTGTGINCPADCTETFTSSQTATLTANPNVGYVFSGWTGCDSVSGNQCTATMSLSRNVTAVFATPRVLTVNINPTGGGTATGTGIACPTDCTETFTSSQTVTLTANPNAGYALSGWTGCDAVSGGQCTVAMNSSKDVTAMFAPKPTYILTVQKEGTGTGTVTSSPPGIDCGADCVEAFYAGALVTLTPTPALGSIFSRWTGDADCLDGQVTMNAVKTCTAVFKRKR